MYVSLLFFFFLIVVIDSRDRYNADTPGTFSTDNNLFQHTITRLDHHRPFLAPLPAVSAHRQVQVFLMN